MVSNFNVKTITQNSPYIAVWEDQIIEVSHSFLELTGYVFENFIGQSIGQLFKRLKICDKKYFAETINICCFIFTKDLDAVEVDIYSVIDKNTTIKKIYFVEKNNNKISEKFIYLNRMCDDNLTSIAIYSAPDLILLKANQKYIDYWDAPYDKLDHCIGEKLDTILPDWTGSETESMWLDVLKTGKTLQVKEFMYYSNKKGIVYWDLTLTPLYEGGRIKYLISSSIDATDRVLNRIQLEKQSKLIAHQNEMLEKALKEQEEFFSNMSHELKTPLNVIFSALQILDLYKNSDELKESKITKYKLIMKQNCYRLLRLINNLIDISKIDSGYLNLQLDNHDIVSIVEDISLSVAEFIEDKGLTLIFDTDVEEKIIACNPDMIERVILNLLSNAIKFTNEGGEIRVTIFDKGEYVNIVVEDTGIGIPEDKLDTIFERFKQVDKSLNRNHEGSGIGLSLVKSLVEMHKGTIEVFSSPGCGSRFSILIPSKIVNTCTIKSSDIISHNKIERISIEFSDIYSLNEYSN